MSRQQRTLPVLTILAALALAACAETPTTPLTAPRSGATPRAAELLATRPGYVRIGVVPSVTEIDIGATGDFVVSDKATGAPLLTGSARQIHVSLVAGTTVANYRLQVVCGNAATRDGRIAAAQAKGYATYTVWNPAGDCWRVYLGEFASNASYSIRTAFKNQAITDGLAAGDAFWTVVTLGVPPKLRLLDGATELVNAGPVVVTPAAGGHVLIAGLEYRGIGEVAVNSSLKLAGVNELPLQEYLYGVVPAELPPVTYPELEALKAQAVAARTYTLAGMGKRAADGYDLLATTADQFYEGARREKPLSTQAVDETAGTVITYEGKLISAMYHSTSGGWTADNEDVYVNVTPVPYLRGIPDAQRGEALEHVPSLDVFRNHANARSLRSAHQGDFESDWARWHRWTFEWSASDISAVLSTTYGDVGEVRAINVLDRSQSGRVGTIEFVTENGTFSAQKDGIRAVLKYIDATGAAANLPSTLFYIEPVIDHKTGVVAGFQVWGGGIGHGLGLAQTGAVGMAQKRATYQEILTHYYQGIALEQR